MNINPQPLINFSLERGMTVSRPEPDLIHFEGHGDEATTCYDLDLTNGTVTYESDWDEYVNEWFESINAFIAWMN